MNKMKDIVKNLLHLISIVIVSPVTVLYFTLNFILKSDALFAGFSQGLSLFPGKIGVYLRAGFYRFTLSSCSPNTVVSFLVLFSQRETEIESGVYIGPQCNIGKCKIEKNVLLGSGVHIMSGKGQHNFNDLTKPIKDQGGTFEKVTIGQNSWVGNSALIMANIGKHCVVAAGAVVIDDVANYTVVAGNPAKMIKKLNT